MTEIVVVVLVVAAVVAVGVALIVVGRRRERSRYADDLGTPRDDRTSAGTELPQAGEDKGHAWFSGGWGGGAGGDGS